MMASRLLSVILLLPFLAGPAHPEPPTARDATRASRLSSAVSRSDVRDLPARRNGSTSSEPKALAVLRFNNNTGDAKYDNLGRGLAAMMISDLSVVEEIQLVERERMEELVAEMELQQSGMVDPETAQTVGLMVGAEYVVAGAFMTVDPDTRLDTRVVRVETTEIVKTADVRGRSDQLLDLQEKLADELIDGIEVVLDEEQRAALRARQEANHIADLETMLKFSSALCLLDEGAYVQALEEMTEVAEAASGSALVDLALQQLEERAKDEAKDRLVKEANRRLGGLLGRDPDPEPERPEGC